MEVDHGRGKSRGQKGRSFGVQQKVRRKEQGQGQTETPWPMSSASRSSLGP